jgi:hypothetical protein
VTRRDAGSSTTEPSIGGSLALAAGAAAAELPAQSRDVGEKFSSIAARLGAAVEELQELSRGVHPAILSDAGLGPALADHCGTGSDDRGALPGGGDFSRRLFLYARFCAREFSSASLSRLRTKA